RRTGLHPTGVPRRGPRQTGSPPARGVARRDGRPDRGGQADRARPDRPDRLRTRAALAGASPNARPSTIRLPLPRNDHRRPRPIRPNPAVRSSPGFRDGRSALSRRNAGSGLMPYAKLNVGRTLAGSDRLTFAAADYTHGLDED